LQDSHDDKVDDDDENLPDGDDPLTYVLPTFGVSFEYEGQIWTVEDEANAAINSGRDIVQLDAQQVGAVLYVEATDEITDAGECSAILIGEMADIVGDDYDISDSEVELSDLPDTDSAAFVADPDDVTEDDARSIAVVVECREFEDGEGVVAFTLMASESDLEDAVDILEPLRESVEFGVDPDEATAGDERDDEDDASGETATYEGSAFPFTYTYDSSVWEVVEQQSSATEDWIMFGGPHGSNLGFTVEPIGRVSARQCVEGYARSYAELVPDVELYEDPDSGETIKFSNRTEAYALYTLTDDDRGPLLVYIHCAKSPDGDAMIVLSGLAPQDELDFVLDEMMPVVDRIEF
jgi:hypothetical protein